MRLCHSKNTNKNNIYNNIRYKYKKSSNKPPASQLSVYLNFHVLL